MNKKPSKFSPEVRDRAVRLVREQRSEHPSMWAAIEPIAPMIGCTPQTLLEWIKRQAYHSYINATEPRIVCTFLSPHYNPALEGGLRLAGVLLIGKHTQYARTASGR